MISKMSTSRTRAAVQDPQDESATLADRVFEQLRRAIVEGEIAPGSKISEPEMAARFGISRGPLREAMRRLESTNLVERRPNLGARVVTLTSEQLIENWSLEVIDSSPAMVENCRSRGVATDEAIVSGDAPGRPAET